MLFDDIAILHQVPSEAQALQRLTLMLKRQGVGFRSVLRQPRSRSSRNSLPGTNSLG